MTDQSPNDIFHASSFMQGHNAEYLEQLYAQYANDPKAVDAAWAEFFRAMGDADGDVKAEAAGPSWARNDWPPAPADDLTAALTGEWPAPVEAKAAGKKIADKAKEKGVRGLEVTRMPGYFKPFHFLTMFEYVRDRAYAKQHFQKYLIAKGRRLRAEGKEVKLW